MSKQMSLWPKAFHSYHSHRLHFILTTHTLLSIVLYSNTSVELPYFRFVTTNTVRSFHTSFLFFERGLGGGGAFQIYFSMSLFVLPMFQRTIHTSRSTFSWIFRFRLKNSPRRLNNLLCAVYITRKAALQMT